ncbi:SDR family NAD(P)-dependent oxidoreductase [bacterium]|jgi:NAD(P)-dependent dehydrogenase (short-subunit alcohol dehydrogenase family)|nr:SDR family NAD(P)-dependent oxidoreductase [bacterium]MBT4926964.1 SDR family NAD(P)-dependent oxidoreductase [bacterium]MBT5734576.1 SDR family NAD(P)-dependent oxidoreductase [bacterium]MBT6018197.1 SDR family NAD(P)-dependent oxidoreductase [bacterium]MBT6777825.1 SDR family NAD(P)-dependent oxidoreductase [bacterium]
MKNIFITGGSRGIGKGLVEQFSKNHKVIFTVRDKNQARLIVDSFEHNNADYVIMDVGENESVQNGVKNLKSKISSVDILINNAGILIPGLKHKINAIDTDIDTIMETFNINTVGVLRVCKAITPFMQPNSRIINISSGMGQLEGMGTGSLAYRLSKTALNAMTIVLSQELMVKKIKVNAICPGWVQTDMGGHDAALTVQESVESIKKFALDGNFPSGKFLRHGEVLPW